MGAEVALDVWLPMPPLRDATGVDVVERAMVRSSLATVMSPSSSVGGVDKSSRRRVVRSCSSGGPPRAVSGIVIWSVPCAVSVVTSSSLQMSASSLTL